MSKPDLDIIHSPEAETFLRMVTEGFYNQSRTGLWMYEIMGREWDEMKAWTEQLKTEIFPQTCTWSIAIWEWVYGFEPDESLSLEYRRQRILSKIFGVRPINPEVIRRGVSVLSDTETEVRDFVGPYRFEIVLYPTDKPLRYADISAYIRRIKPAHLTFTFRIIVRELSPTYIYTGGTLSMVKRTPIPEAPDVYNFKDPLRVGGRSAVLSSLPIPEKTSRKGGKL